MTSFPPELLDHRQKSRQPSPSLACTTTPCPTTGWPPVMWKGSGAHVPLSVQALEPLLAATP
ncbi:unnamed protein product [Spirodela intermedia]|uniref:Uncharacterized protein n=1 Tax=Spirodela intermedia TaxID=51605 RepID=A0A7I8JSI8_SPIIN|nr:unnamed protein product [Spirodela intermedia]CAA6672543.1 unnamed protein product [Spirodela intermedia]